MGGGWPELLERQERKLRRGKRREGWLDGEFTERELHVLRLLDGGFSAPEMGRLLYVAPSTVRTHIKSTYRTLGVSSREKAVVQAHTRELIWSLRIPVNPLGETRRWVRTDGPAVTYAQGTLESGSMTGNPRGHREGLRIEVRGELSRRYAAAFKGMEMETANGRTILTGEVIDQVQLHGILDRISSLGLELVSVQSGPEKP
jgi:DNA-binding CsgD family transcriptional regulator